MGDWRETTLGALGAIFDGPHATPERRTAGPYFLNIASLKDGHLDLALSDHVSVDDFALWTRRVRPRQGDLLFSYETRLGEAAMMPTGVEACLGRRMALLRPDSRIVNPRFLLYLYLGPAMQATIERNTIHGATVNRIPLKTMASWPVRLPGMAEQRAIAEVLGALDDKIAANTRLATAAVEVARTRFVRALEISEVEATTVGASAVTVLGGTPSRDDLSYWTGGTVGWLNSGKANEARIHQPSEWITEEALAKSAAKVMPPRATVLAITGATLGQVARLEIAASGNQSLIGVWSHDPAMNDWLYFAIQHEIPQLLRAATGAAQQHVNKRDVDALAIPVLVDADLAPWGAQVRPLLDRAASSDRENLALAATRDALLPALMSGKLRVRDAERLAEAHT